MIYENGEFWVLYKNGLYYVMKDGLTHAESIGGVAWEDRSCAIAYCDYQARKAA